MELLLEIKDAEFDESDKSLFTVRNSSRAVLFDENMFVPLLFVAKFHFYKLPGGGIEPNEDSIAAVRREVVEEIGSEIEIISEIGKIIVYDSLKSIKKISYCYLGKIISKGEPHFTEKELANGFSVVWLPLKDAISKLSDEKVRNDKNESIQRRDLTFLKKVKQMIEEKIVFNN